MLNDVIIGRYIKKDSLFHKRTPVLKIVIALLLIISFLVTKNLIIIFLLGLLLLLMIKFSKLSLMIFVKSIKGIRWIIYFLIIFFIIVRADAIESFVKIYQLVFVLMVSVWLTLVTSPRELTYGIERILSFLKIFKIDVSALAFTISLGLRFIPTILDSSSKILKSQASRGVDYNHGTLKEKFIIVKSILVPLFVISIRKSDELASAMTVKSYKVGAKRTYLNIDNWNITDTLFLIEYMILFILICMGGYFL
jgi:ABC-type cobalt transport system, permease component CbiQ and related transporters